LKEHTTAAKQQNEQDRVASIAAASSVDPQEIEKFNKLAATWWDASGPMWPLHTLNNLRSSYIVQQLADHFKHSLDSTQPLSGLGGGRTRSRYQ